MILDYYCRDYLVADQRWPLVLAAMTDLPASGESRYRHQWVLVLARVRRPEEYHAALHQKRNFELLLPDSSGESLEWPDNVLSRQFE